MRRFYHFFILVAAVLAVSGCAAPAAATQLPLPTPVATAAEASTLTIFAAASLTDAFNELGQNFTTAHPGVEVVFNFAGSNQLATQIGEGAPADVFASANAAQMSAAIDSGRIVTGTQLTFVGNRLVVVMPSDNPSGLTELQDLAKPRLKIVLAAKEVPVGQYALDFLDKAEADGSLGAGYKDKVLANVVSYEENVRGVLTKVALGEADAGIVYASDSASAPAEVATIAIPDPLNTIARYPIAPLADSAQLELAQQFVDYVLSADGQQVLAKYGFIPVK